MFKREVDSALRVIASGLPINPLDERSRLSGGELHVDAHHFTSSS